MNEKIFEYFYLKELHYQNQLTHYIYRNTHLASIRRREANFWRIAQIPASILTVTNLGVFYLSVFWGFIFLLFTIVVSLIITCIIYNYKVKSKNRDELKIIKLTNCMINLRYLTEEINLIKKYNIPIDSLINDSDNGINIVQLKLKQFKRYIIKDLEGIWVELRFESLKKEKLISFLNRIDMDIDIFLDRLKLYKLFCKQNQIEVALISLDKKIKLLEMMRD
ncbi:hypothetical protein ES705_13371 [subsurface metagenome]